MANRMCAEVMGCSPLPGLATQRHAQSSGQPCVPAVRLESEDAETTEALRGRARSPSYCTERATPTELGLACMRT